MKRREFITLLGGAAAAWPLRRARSRASGCDALVCSRPTLQDDPEGRARLTAFAQGLQQAGWTVGRNVRIDYRWGDGNADTHAQIRGRIGRACADVILASASAAVCALLQATRTMPIVFVHVADPVGAGFVDSLARPGSNITGFTPSNMR